MLYLYTKTEFILVLVSELNEIQLSEFDFTVFFFKYRGVYLIFLV